MDNGDRVRLYLGDCQEVMAQMEAESVHAIVSDPPYGLEFMGKGWDRGVPGPEFWSEALRVARPGAHLLAFGGTRTFHRLACAIEDAGWEIRDCVMWVYGSGFPKSHNIGKAIDKANGDPARLHKFTAWMRTTGVTARQLNDATGTNMGGHYLTAASQPAIPTAELWKSVRPLCGDVPAWVDDLVSRVEAEREVLARREVPKGHSFAGESYRGDDVGRVEYADTAPATEAARRWEGWGTALKPAWEPIIVARKPFSGTVAANVLEHGTGAINVDGCRVVASDGHTTARARAVVADTAAPFGRGAAMGGDGSPFGRWPANLIHDGSEEAVAGFPETGGESFGAGSAARYFYAAKASKADRDAGLGDLPEATPGERSEREDGSAGINPYAGTRGPARNIHPTVKPTDLMRYLCRLVTPFDGVVLDPFMGSGSTGRGAVLEGFRFVGIDVTPEYVEIARRRIAEAEQRARKERPGRVEVQPDLFGGGDGA